MVMRRRRSSNMIRRSARRGAPATRRRTSLFGWIFRSAAQTELRLEVENHIAREIWAIIYITLAIITYLSLSGGMGLFGAWWADSFRSLFGIGIYSIPLLLAGIGVVMLTQASVQFNFTKVFGIVLLVASALGVVHLSAPEGEMLSAAADFGGLTGFVASVFFRIMLDVLGAQIILVAVFLISILLTFGISLREVIAWTLGRDESPEPSKGDKDESDDLKIRNWSEKSLEAEEPKPQAAPAKEPAPKKETFRINAPTSIKIVDEFKPQKNKVSDADWVPPSLDLLDAPAEQVKVDEEALRAKAEVIRQKLEKFGLDVTMYDVNLGPAVMQYTLKPAEGIKLSKIVGLKHDLALALAAKSIRIEAPIPGKSLVGIEIPNENRTTVRMKELLQSKAFAALKSPLRLVLGRDVSGQPIITDLARMPHLLVAGATGSGKSVGINSFMLSLIYQNSPADLRFILVDPKMVELAPYNGIPHLLTPVINDPEKTISALKWAVAEMTRRYKLCRDTKVRSITEYNATDPEEKMPFIVIVIDEMADLMMVASKEVEGCIMRLAQMARAVGIHLILATQRPSVNVITGVIKANIPTRLSFAVTSGVDSKTILDCVGAEDLLGQGDMLFIPPGESKPIRIQGAFVSTEEVRRVTNSIKLDLGEDAQPEYKDEITEGEHNVVLPGVKQEVSGSDDDDDETLVLKAARIVVETGRASTTFIQRRLSIGYARAARVLDLMAERGMVGPANGAKPRDVYITSERLGELEGNQGEIGAQRQVEDALNDLEDERG